MQWPTLARLKEPTLRILTYVDVCCLQRPTLARLAEARVYSSSQHVLHRLYVQSQC